MEYVVGNTKRCLKLVSEAFAAANRATAGSPCDNAIYYNNMAIAHQSIDKSGVAAFYYQKAIHEVSPNFIFSNLQHSNNSTKNTFIYILADHQAQPAPLYNHQQRLSQMPSRLRGFAQRVN